MNNKIIDYLVAGTFMTLIMLVIFIFVLYVTRLMMISSITTIICSIIYVSTMIYYIKKKQ